MKADSNSPEPPLPPSAPTAGSTGELQPAGTIAVFRRQAVARYVRRSEEQVLPALTSPRALLWLWLLLALLGVGCLGAGLYLDATTQGIERPVQRSGDVG